MSTRDPPVVCCCQIASSAILKIFKRNVERLIDVSDISLCRIREFSVFVVVPRTAIDDRVSISKAQALSKHDGRAADPSSPGITG